MSVNGGNLRVFYAHACSIRAVLRCLNPPLLPSPSVPSSKAGTTAASESTRDLSKKNQSAIPKENRILISINVIGNAGPIRMVVNEEETAANVIDLVLKSYAREGRLPVLGSAINKFLLYCPIAGSDALSPEKTIGRYGVRNFMLGKKPETLVGIAMMRHLLFQKL